MSDPISNLCTVIISSITTLVTLAAVFVALWQTKWPYSVKLQVKAKIVENKYQIDADKYFREKKLFIQVCNVGLTDSSILCWGLCVNKRSKFDVQYYGEKARVLKSKTMMRNSVPLYLFQDPVKCMLLKRSKSNKKLIVYFRDISGKTFYQPVDMTVKRLVEMSYADFKSPITEEEYESYYLEYIDFEPLAEYLRENDFKNGK